MRLITNSEAERNEIMKNHKILVFYSFNVSFFNSNWCDN